MPPIPLHPSLWLALALLVAAPGSAAAADWIRPVDGRVVRPFAYGPDPFARGEHRGVDLAAPPGTRVRAACGGAVVFAGRVPRYGRVVSVRCGRWRVSYAPLGSVAVRRGAIVAPGAVLGAAGRGHGGLHIGVRREGRRFGYVDPAARFGVEPRRPAPLGPVPRLRGPWLPPPRLPTPAPRSPATPRPPAPAPWPSAPRLPAPVLTQRTGVPVPGVAPWPAWAGLALVLLSAAGGGAAARRRVARRRAPARADWHGSAA